MSDDGSDRHKSKFEVALNKSKFARRAPVVSRRKFVATGSISLVGGLLTGNFFLDDNAVVAETGTPPIRPPTANPLDSTFQQACIRCGLCGTVCENGCIRFFGSDEPEFGAMTPYIDVRRRSCTLCMRCTQICPSGALTDVEDDLEQIVEHVDMGVAEVDPDRCLSYLGRVCGYCHDACPLPNIAIRLTPPARPVVLPDGCVGCGRCVEECPQYPTAIEVRRA